MKLEKEKTALVVIDMQKSIARMDRKLEPYALEEIVGNVSRLAKAFRQALPYSLYMCFFMTGRMR